MAEGFEPYHVPQQSRRDKLRVLNNQPTLPNHNLHSHQAPLLFPACNFYDPSPPPISPDLLNLHRQSFNPAVKEEGINLMGFMGGVSGGGGLNVITASSSEHHLHRNSGDINNPVYADPQLVAAHINNPSNPTTILQDINNYNNYRAAAAAAVVDHPNNHDQSFHHHHHGKQVINGQSLSLSLSSHHGNNGNNNNLPLELNLHHQRYITTNNNGYDDSPSLLSGNNSNKVSGLGGYLVPGNGGLSRSSVPLGPFTGYASVLNGSRFLKPAQHLLGEICEVGLRGIYGSGVDKFSAAAAEEEDSTALLNPDHPPLESHHDDSVSCSIDVSEQTRKKSGLLSMLEEVYKRYKMYYQQVQAVVASFESVAGLSNAAPFANLALKALTKHFRCLKDAITDQLQFATTKCHGNMYNYERDEAQRVENNLGKGPFGQRSFQNAGGSFVDQPVWRPQRGLPERAVTVLRAWLFEHFLHPYPTDTDKLSLAKQTGLSRNQVSNWFINARVRLWKPMVEEIHTLETRQGQRHNSQRDEPTPNRSNDHLPSGSLFDCENNATTSMQRMGEFSLKRNREDPSHAIRGTEGPMNLPYENLSHHPQFTSNAGGSGSVSLTLGLHQNGGGLPESYPINAARRFGLDSSHGGGGGDQGYLLGGFGGQNRQFGGDIIG